MQTGIARRVPKGLVPPTWYPECRSATAGAQGTTAFTLSARARLPVATSQSPCISTTSGRFASSSITSVLITACSSTPSARAETAVPPRSS